MQLPDGAQTWQSCGYDNGWSLTDHLTASVFDALQIGNWQRAGGTKANQPAPMQRPSDAKEEASKRDRLAERARRAYERQQLTPTPQPRLRDARGRFVKEGS